ncbi:MAG: SDR family NAD(P)-dependent oxidoreductase [Rhodospirillaceae bacterium]|nr:SDR family NAD(P)-dependent oxidoreductase [Rhodospirillaceae bacterium]
MRVVVTGAGRGIGRAICEVLAKQGATHIVASDVAQNDDLPQLVQHLQATGIKADAIPADLADAQAGTRMMQAAIERMGGLDALVSNAGIADPAPLAELTLASWDKVLNVNVRASFVLAQAGYAALKASKGSIVTMASMAGVNPQVGMGAYSVSKGALVMLTNLLAQEWARDGIRVNAVSPGFVHTPLSAKVYADPEVKARREAMVPLGNIAEPADIADVVAFLVSPAARYITGQNIVVDGGMTTSLLRKVPGRPRNVR